MSQHAGRFRITSPLRTRAGDGRRSDGVSVPAADPRWWSARCPGPVRGRCAGGETALQLINHLSDQLVRASHGTARIVDEFALELFPATVVALCPLRPDQWRVLS